MKYLNKNILDFDIDLGWVTNSFHDLNKLNKQFINLFNDLFQDITVIKSHFNAHEIDFTIDDHIIFPVRMTEFNCDNNKFKCSCSVYTYETINDDDYPINLGDFYIEFETKYKFSLMTCHNLTFKLITNYFAINVNSTNLFNYHTIEHVQFMLNELNKIQYSLTEIAYRMLYLAICFHDSNYDPASNKNEETACEILEKTLYYTRLLDYADTKNICSMIQCTKINTEIKQIYDTYYADILHDLDYLYFSKSIEYNKMISGLIYNEVFHLVKTRTEYLKLRIEFLESILEKDEIYLSRFYIHLNEQAKTNIKKLIQQYKVKIKND